MSLADLLKTGQKAAGSPGTGAADDTAVPAAAPKSAKGGLAGLLAQSQALAGGKPAPAGGYVPTLGKQPTPAPVPEAQPAATASPLVARATGGSTVGQFISDTFAAFPDSAAKVSKAIVQTPADWLADTQFIKNWAGAGQGDKAATAKGFAANTAESVIGHLANYGNAYFSGLTGGLYKAPENAQGHDDGALAHGVDAVLGAVGTGLGAMEGIKSFTAVAGGLATPAAVVNFLGKYPTVGKYAIPLIQNTVGFGIYGQLNPDLGADFGKRVEDLGLAIVTAPLYTALGAIKSAKYSLPASFGLGFGMAKMSGASNKDAIAAGLTFSFLDGASRAGAPAFVTGRKVDDALHSEALSTLSRYAGTDINTNSTPEEIKAAYRAAAKATHPDLGGNSQDFIAVQSAYDFLNGKGTTLQPGAAAANTERASITPESYDSVLDHLEHSDGLNIQKSIADGDVKPEQIYKDQATGVLTPEFAQGRIDDVANKLNQYHPGLGDSYRDTVDPANTTMEDIVQKGVTTLKAVAAIPGNVEAAPDETVTAEGFQAPEGGAGAPQKLPPEQIDATNLQTAVGKLAEGAPASQVIYELSQFVDTEKAKAIVAQAQEQVAAQPAPAAAPVAQSPAEPTDETVADMSNTDVLERTPQDFQDAFIAAEEKHSQETQQLRDEIAAIGRELERAPDKSKEKKDAKIKLSNAKNALAEADKAYYASSVDSAQQFREFFRSHMDDVLELGLPKQKVDALIDTIASHVTDPQALTAARKLGEIAHEIIAGEVGAKRATPRKDAPANKVAVSRETRASLATALVREGYTPKQVNDAIGKSRSVKGGYDPEEVRGNITGKPKGSDKKAPPSKKPTQKEAVKKALSQKGEASIKYIAEETKILEPNVRRILGVGAKTGDFERVDDGVYRVKVGDQELALIFPGDALEVLPKLVKDGFKSDMVFLDIPYNTAAVRGGNRGVKYNLISVEQFGKVLDSVKAILKTKDAPLIHMFSQARSGKKQMDAYNDLILAKGFKPIARGDYTKLQQDGLTRVRNMRGNIVEPEGIILFNQSGKTPTEVPNLNFKLVRPRGYQTEKPAEMLKSLITMTTKEGDVVLDPFAGSGVTGAEAVRAGRRAVLIEKDEEQAKKIQERIQEAAPSPIKEPKAKEPAKKPSERDAEVAAYADRPLIERIEGMATDEYKGIRPENMVHFNQGSNPRVSLIVPALDKEIIQATKKGAIGSTKSISSEYVRDRVARELGIPEDAALAYMETRSDYLKALARENADKNAQVIVNVVRKEAEGGKQTRLKTRAGKTQRIAGANAQEEAGSYLQEVKDRLKLDFDVHFADAILSGYKINPFTKVRTNVEAEGAMFDNTITLAKEFTKYAPHHEVGHLVFANLDSIPVMKVNGITQEGLLEAQAKKMGVDFDADTSSKTRKDIEEQMMLDYENWYESQGEEPVGLLRKFFNLLKSGFTRFMRAVGVTKGNILDDFYSILKDGREVADGIRRFENTGVVKKFIQDGVLDTDKMEASLRAKVEEEHLTTVILDRLGERTAVSKQFILDLTNAADVKKPEKELILNALQDEPQTVSVQEFKEKIKTSLLPLRIAGDTEESAAEYETAKRDRSKLFDRQEKAGLPIQEYLSQNPDEAVELTRLNRAMADAAPGTFGGDISRYDSVTLPGDMRGPIAAYREKIYNSPIKTSVGRIHFQGRDSSGYFAHTRIEDLPVGETKRKGTDINNDPIYDIPSQAEVSGGVRRLIEIQSDLFQRGRLEGEGKTGAPTDIGADEEFGRLSRREMMIESAENREAHLDELAEIQEAKKKLIDGFAPKALAFKAQRDAELAKLEPYRNTWYERVIREEMKAAAHEGKDTMLFPTGETAMRVEGLGGGTWEHSDTRFGDYERLWPSDLKVGSEVWREGQSDQPWIVTAILGDGKFTAVPKDNLDFVSEELTELGFPGPDDAVKAIADGNKEVIALLEDGQGSESFDISGNVDKTNPIYKFYEGPVSKYVKNRYGAEPYTDDQGVTWMKASVDPALAETPVTAFKLGDEKSGIKRAEEAKFNTALAKESGLSDQLAAWRAGARENGASEDEIRDYLIRKERLDVTTKRLAAVKDDILNVDPKDVGAVRDIGRRLQLYRASLNAQQKEFETNFKMPKTGVKIPIAGEAAPAPAPKASEKTDDSVIRSSRAYQRVLERFGDELGDDAGPTYSVTNMADEVAKAMQFVEEFPEDARRIALGLQSPPYGLVDTETAISVAYSEKMLDEGKFAAMGDAERSRSLRQTQRGKEISMERGRVANSPQAFIQEVIKARMEQAGRELFAGFKSPLKAEGASYASKAADKIKVEAKDLKTKVLSKKLDIEEAQAILDSIVC